MTVATRTGNVARRVAHLNVVKEATATPTATGTLTAGGQQPVARDHTGASPAHAPQKPRRSDEPKLALISPKPGKNHSKLARGNMSPRALRRSRITCRTAVTAPVHGANAKEVVVFRHSLHRIALHITDRP